MKNFFYNDQITEKVKDLLLNIPLEKLKNITCGDFTCLPLPDELEGYFPAVIISEEDIENQFANDVTEVLYSPYRVIIYYLYPYTFEVLEDTPKEARKTILDIANIFMNDRTLGNFEIPRGDTEAGGRVISSLVSNINFNPAEGKFFQALEIPCSVAKITLDIDFRTFERRD